VTDQQLSDDATRARSFGAIAEDYDRLRPGPPPAALDWLLPSGCRRAADIGAGTGLFTRALAERVPEVVAVEPDERMARVLATRSPGVRVLGGQAESLPLEDDSLDAVYVSAAWHWMDSGRAGAEFARVLRPGGRLGLLWTNRDHDVDWIAELEKSRGGRELTGSLQYRRRRREVILPEELPFTTGTWETFRFTRTMTVDDFVAWQSTYSGLIIASSEERDAGLARVRQLVQQRFGDATTLDVPMTSLCWRADRTVG
jgi:SAM-dependent methyltransferase